MERGKIEEEYAELIKLIEELRSILESEQKLLEIIKTELLEQKEKYGSPRRCEIVPYEGDISKADMTLVRVASSLFPTKDSSNVLATVNTAPRSEAGKAFKAAILTTRISSSTYSPPIRMTSFSSS